MKDFKKLEIWQRSRNFIKNIYSISQNLPKEEDFGLIGLKGQIRRASVSIILNISEGSSRSTDKDFRRFIQFAIGSASEVEAILIICNDLDYISELELTTLTSELIVIRKMLINFSKKLAQ